MKKFIICTALIPALATMSQEPAEARRGFRFSAPSAPRVSITRPVSRVIRRSNRNESQPAPSAPVAPSAPAAQSGMPAPSSTPPLVKDSSAETISNAGGKAVYSPQNPPPGHYYSRETGSFVPRNYVYDAKSRSYVYKGPRRRATKAVVQRVVPVRTPISTVAPRRVAQVVAVSQEIEEPYVPEPTEPSYIRNQRRERQLAAQIAAHQQPSRTRPTRVRPTVIPASFSGKCMGVIDGDSITVMYGQKPVQVTLYGVDSPESAQPFGAQAKEYTAQQVLGKTVKIYTKGSSPGAKQAWVFCGSQCVNASLVENGVAWWNKQSAPAESKLAALETAARAEKRGLWSDDSAQAPWEFRQAQP